MYFVSVKTNIINFLVLKKLFSITVNYGQIIELNYTPQQENEIIWKQSTTFFQGNHTALECFQPIKRRNWRIKSKNSGNMEKLIQNFE